MSTSPAVMGSAAHATHFVILADLGGFLVLLRGLESRRLLTLFWSGFLFGVSVLMKQHGVFLAFFAFGVLLFKELSTESAVSGGDSPATGLQNPCGRINNEFAAQAAATGCLFVRSVVPYALTCLILWRVGVFDKFCNGRSFTPAGIHCATLLKIWPGIFSRWGRFFLGLGRGGFFPSLRRPCRPALDEGFCGRFTCIFLCCRLSRLYFFPH